MNTLSTIDGRVVDDDRINSVNNPPKLKSRMLQRALSAGRRRVPPSYKDAERSLSPEPRAFGRKSMDDAYVNNNNRESSLDVGNAYDNATDTREPEIPMKKHSMRSNNSNRDPFPDDASREEASVDRSPIKPATTKEVRAEKRYIERAASTGRARSAGRYGIDYRPRYRDQPKQRRNSRVEKEYDHSHHQQQQHQQQLPFDQAVIERQKTIDNSDLKTSSPYSIQTGIQPNVSGLTATHSPRMMHKVVDAVVTTSPPPPPPRTVSSALVTPEKTSRHVGFRTPESNTSKTVHLASSPEKVGTNAAVTLSGGDNHQPSWQEVNRREQARQRLMERMKGIDARVKSRSSYEQGGQSPGVMKSLKPWEVVNDNNTTRTSSTHHVLDGVPDQDQSKLIVPPLMDEDGVWRDPAPTSSPTGYNTISPNNAYATYDTNNDDGMMKSLQSRVEYYKTCLKSNEKKLDELIDSEKELHEMLKSQQEEYENQQRQDRERHEREMEEVNGAMGEAKKAMDALESTIQSLNASSQEKDGCIVELKEKLSLMELELKERITTNEERVTEYEEQITGLKSSVSELKSSVAEKDQKIASLTKEVASLTDKCSETEAAYQQSCGTLEEKEKTLAETVEKLEQEKNDLVYNFEKYRGDLEYKMEATTVRMEAITKEKDKLIASLHTKVELLESSVIEKEGQVKQHVDWKLAQAGMEADWMLKEKEMSGNIRTLAMSLDEKDKELDNLTRLLEHERKLKAASDERIGAMKNELMRIQKELIDSNRKQEEEADRIFKERHRAKVAKALTPRSAARRKKSGRGRELPREDPPASPRGTHNRGRSEYYSSPRNTRPRARTPEEERYVHAMAGSFSTEYDSSDSVFDFSS